MTENYLNQFLEDKKTDKTNRKKYFPDGRKKLPIRRN